MLDELCRVEFDVEVLEEGVEKEVEVAMTRMTFDRFVRTTTTRRWL